MDVIFDTLGRDTPAHSWGVVKPRGVVVSVVSPRPTNPPDLAGVRFAWFIVEPSREQLRQSSVLLDTGQIRPIVTDVFPLKEALQSYVAALQSHARGRIVLQVGESLPVHQRREANRRYSLLSTRHTYKPTNLRQPTGTDSMSVHVKHSVNRRTYR